MLGGDRGHPWLPMQSGNGAGTGRRVACAGEAEDVPHTGEASGVPSCWPGPSWQEWLGEQLFALQT